MKAHPRIQQTSSLPQYLRFNLNKIAHPRSAAISSDSDLGSETFIEFSEPRRSLENHGANGNMMYSIADTSESTGVTTGFCAVMMVLAFALILFRIRGFRLKPKERTPTGSGNYDAKLLGEHGKEVFGEDGMDAEVEEGASSN